MRHWGNEQQLYSESQLTKKVVDYCPKEPSSPSQDLGFLNTKRRKGVLGWYRLLGSGILCSCSCPCRFGHNTPNKLKRDTCYCLFCNFLSLNEQKSVIPLEARALPVSSLIYFRFQATFLTHSKHNRIQTLKFKNKNRSNIESDLSLEQEFLKGRKTEMSKGLPFLPSFSPSFLFSISTRVSNAPSCVGSRQ